MNFDYHNHNIEQENCFSSISLQDYINLHEKINTRNNQYLFLEFHPWLNEDFSNREAQFIEILNSGKFKGIGEIGLDCSPKYIANIEQQKQNFIQLLKLAEKYQMPIILHIVKSWHIAREILKDFKIPQIYVHGFWGKTELLKEIITFGCFVSLNYKMLERKELYEFLNNNPIFKDKIGLETDNNLNLNINDLYQIYYKGLEKYDRI